MKTNYKNTLLITITLSVFWLNSIRAQQYQPLPDSNAAWLVQEWCSEYTVYHFWYLSDFQNDTIINSNVYTKLFYSLYGANSMEFTGAFRSLTNGKTYFVPAGDQQEVLLQDLTTQKGDTVHNVAVHNLQYLGAFDFIVDTVNYFPCGPYSLKTITLHSIETIPSIYGTSLHWVEKIGSISGGILNQPEMGLNTFKLICQSTIDTTFYNVNAGYFPQSLVYYPGNCDEFLSIDKPKANDPFLVYPNPFNSQLNIRSENNYQDILIEIYDLIGSLLVTEKIHNFSNPYLIRTLPNLKPGIYFLIISNKNKQLWKQIITKM